MLCAPVFFKSVEVGASLFKIDTDGAVASAPAAAPKSAPAPTPTPTPAAPQHGIFLPLLLFLIKMSPRFFSIFQNDNMLNNVYII
jgi:hypothetical protein